MTPETELAHLRREVALLRKQMDDLLRFITIETDEGETVPHNMNLRCGVVMFQDPEEPHTPQMFLGASDQGPLVSLWDSQGQGRLSLHVKDDVPAVILYSAEMKQAVRLEANPDDGCGLVVAFDNGQPRAVLKAGEGGSGSVSIVHDDGNARITMHGTENSGSLLAVNPDMQVTVKISSGGPNDGGLVVVNSATGRPAAFLTHGPEGGIVVVHGPDGQPVASLPDAGL